MRRIHDGEGDEQARTLVNLRQRYEVCIEAERVLAALPYDLRRKEVSGHAYLYERYDRGGNGKSLDRLSDEHAAQLMECCGGAKPPAGR